MTPDQMVKGQRYTVQAKRSKGAVSYTGTFAGIAYSLWNQEDSVVIVTDEALPVRIGLSMVAGIE